MSVRLEGSWPPPLPIVIRWLADHAGVKALTAIPENLPDSLPAVVVSPAPAGVDMGDYTRSGGVDIDVYAADWESMDVTISSVTSALASLQGDGNEYGYVDSSELTPFSAIADPDPDVLRCTATVTLSTRPQ